MCMGDYIVIENQIGPFEFACESVSTGTPFTAIIDDDKYQIFLDHTFPDQHPDCLPVSQARWQILYGA